MEADYHQEIVNFIDKHGTLPDSIQWAKDRNVGHQVVVGALKSLYQLELVVLVQIEKKEFGLTPEGQDYQENGFPEYRLLQLVSKEGVPKAELEVTHSPSSNGYLFSLKQKSHKSLLQFGMQNGIRKKWIAIEAGNLVRKVENVEDEDHKKLTDIKNGQIGPEITKEVVADFKKRKLITEHLIKYYEVQKGAKFSTTIPKFATDVTVDMIANETWGSQQFKPYNWNALGKETSTGNLHPLLKVRTQFRGILLELGFEEMPTDNYVESSFWNFDALFTAQQHPCRDMQDTFFVSDPPSTAIEHPEYYKKVKEVHEVGGYGSIGWRYKFNDTTANSNILRTHTTAFSTKMLYKLAQQKEFTPKKYFSIDRVFRNEKIDATHLAEFHQIEGVIADRNLGLPELMGIIKEFYAKIGIHNIKFKPAYNPYTEPSMEIYGYHPLLKRWVEIANSGVFRPEMLEPMGLPKDVSVIAWGLALERPCMILNGYTNIRDLWGDTVPLKLIRDNKIACFE